MKKIVSLGLIVLLIALFSACCPNKCNAQSTTQSEIVSIDLSKLSPAAKEAVETQIKLQEATLNSEAQNRLIENEIARYVEWAGMGQEVGIAVSGALGAIKDVTLEIAESDVGKITIWLVVWKVAGIDFVQIFVGLLLLIVSTVIIIRSYSRTFNRKILIKGGWRQPKEWETKTYRDNYWEYPNAAAAAHWVIWLIMIGVSSLVMFA